MPIMTMSAAVLLRALPAPALPAISAAPPPPPAAHGPDSPGCYANCDSSTPVPFLNVNDFVCFNEKFAAGDTHANCDQSTIAPILNVNDFVCFNNLFAAGCSAP
ncbi:MAG: hypothetical protein ACKVW3_00995 [Phycisphaerales bacterium]